MQTDTRKASVNEVIRDPLFRRGYEEIWTCAEHAVDLRWDDQEQLAYERGRQFGIYVMTEEKRYVPLIKGGAISPRAQVLLVTAYYERAIR